MSQKKPRKCESHDDAVDVEVDVVDITGRNTDSHARKLVCYFVL